MILRHRSLGELAGLDELDPRHRATVREHLAACAPCRARVTLVRDVRARAAEATTLVPGPENLAQILARRAAGDRVILPADHALSPPRRRPVLAIAAAASLVITMAIAAQYLLTTSDTSAGSPPGAGTQGEETEPVGISIVPGSGPVDVRISGTASLTIDVTIHAGPDLGVRGSGAAASARFRTAGGGVAVSGANGGRLDVRIPRGTTGRLFVNDRMEVTFDGRSLRVERSGALRDHVLLTPRRD